MLPARAGFWLSGPILVAALLGELLWYLLRALVFPFQRAGAREWARRAIVGGGPALPADTGAHSGSGTATGAKPPARAGAAVGRAPLAIAAAALLALAGCTTFPGASFQDQIDGLAWSTYELFLSEHPMDNLEDIGLDLQAILFGRDFEDATHKQLVESLEMLGW
jgi:hypothetical protein